MNAKIYTVHIKGTYNADEMHDWLHDQGYTANGVEVYESVADETLCARFDYKKPGHYFKTECMSFDDKDFFTAYSDDYFTALHFALLYNAEIIGYL